MTEDVSHTKAEEPASYDIWACPHDHIHLEIKMKDDRIFSAAFADPDEAYNFAQALLRAYDDATQQ